jgi:hypothetical protein
VRTRGTKQTGAVATTFERTVLVPHVLVVEVRLLLRRGTA